MICHTAYVGQLNSVLSLSFKNTLQDAGFLREPRRLELTHESVVICATPIKEQKARRFRQILLVSRILAWRVDQ